MKTKKLYLCKIGEVKGIQDTLFGAVKKVFYFYHDCARFWKYVRPVMRAQPGMQR